MGFPLPEAIFFGFAQAYAESQFAATASVGEPENKR